METLRPPYGLFTDQNDLQALCEQVRKGWYIHVRCAETLTVTSGQDRNSRIRTVAFNQNIGFGQHPRGPKA